MGLVNSLNRPEVRKRHAWFAAPESGQSYAADVVTTETNYSDRLTDNLFGSCTLKKGT